MIRTVREAIESLMKGLPAAGRKIKGYESADIWEKQIAAGSWAYKFNGGTLFVATENPSLAQQINFSKEQKIERLNRLAGNQAVKDIKVKVSSRKEEQ